MKNKKLFYTLGIGLFLIIIFWFLIRLFLFSALTPMDVLNKIDWIDKIDKNKEVCFKSIKNNNFSIDCFIPNKLSEYQKKYAYSDTELKSFLESAKITQDKVLSFDEEPLFYQIFDKMQPNISNISWISSTYKDIKKKLEYLFNKNEWVLDEYLAYYYMMNLEWNYKKSDIVKDKTCTKFKYLCKNDLVYAVITWKVIDEKNNPLAWVNIEFAWIDKKVKTNDNGEYYISESLQPYTKIRIKANKANYSDWVAAFDIISPVKKQSFSKNFTLIKAWSSIEIDTKNITIKWNNVSKTNSAYIIKTEWSEYSVPYNAIVYSNWKQYIWKLTAYTWEFNKNSDLSSLLNSDIFDDVAWYAWDLMKTFWMPYILFISDKWERLHVLKSNPMILKTRIQEMRALKTNQDKIYSELTDKDFEFLISKSKELWGFPIDRLFLANNNILRFPAFWVFDQYKWVWVNEWMRVLNKDWDWELRFYTMSDKL